LQVLLHFYTDLPNIFGYIEKTLNEAARPSSTLPSNVSRVIGPRLASSPIQRPTSSAVQQGASSSSATTKGTIFGMVS